MRSGFLVALLAVLIGNSSDLRASAQENTVGRALLVGATRYPNLRDEADAGLVDLRGPANDVDLFQETLTEVLGFAPEHIQTLKGWPDDEKARPTLANIREHFARLAREAQPGELVFLFLAGHGVQQPAAEGDRNERDGLDEVFLPADAEPDPEREDCFRFALTDDELGQWLTDIRETGARVWLVVDSCHSATLQRGGGTDDEVRTRTLPPEIHRSPSPRGASTPQDGHSADPSSPGVVAFYAAQSYQKAPEMKLPRGASEYRGFFSYQLGMALARAGAGATYGEVFELLQAGYQAWPCRVTPAAEGDLAQTILGDGEREHQLLLNREAGAIARLWLNAGSLHGMVEGNRLRAYPPGQRGAENAALGELEVRKCELTRSLCAPPADAAVAFAEAGPGPWAADVTERMVSAHALQVSFVDHQSRSLPRAAWPDLLQELAGEAFLQVVDPLVAEVHVRLRDDDVLLHYLTHDSYHTVSRSDLREGLARMFKVKNLLRVADDSLRLPFPAGLEVAFQLVGEGDTRRLVQQDEWYRPGVLGDIQVHNDLRSKQSHDLWVFQVRSDFSIAEVFPGNGREPTISGKDVRNPELGGPWLNDDATSGPEYLVSMALEAGSGSLSYLSNPGLKPAPSLRGDGVSSQVGFLDAIASVSQDGLRGVRVRHEKDVPSVRALRYFTGWPACLEPWPRSPGARELDPGTRPFSLGKGLETWDPAAGGILWTQSDRVLAGQDRFEWFLLDLDGDTPLPEDPEAAFAVLAAGGFDAELAIHVGGQGQRTFLDRDGDGQFDEMVVDADRDGWAEARWRRDGDAGSLDTDLHLPWLRVADVRLRNEKVERGPALQKVHSLFEGPQR